jgi:hypothetical protein
MTTDLLRVFVGAGDKLDDANDFLISGWLFVERIIQEMDTLSPADLDFLMAPTDVGFMVRFVDHANAVAIYPALLQGPSRVDSWRRLIIYLWRHTFWFNTPLPHRVWRPWTDVDPPCRARRSRGGSGEPIRVPIPPHHNPIREP